MTPASEGIVVVADDERAAVSRGGPPKENHINITRYEKGCTTRLKSYLVLVEDGTREWRVQTSGVASLEAA